MVYKNKTILPSYGWLLKSNYTFDTSSFSNVTTYFHLDIYVSIDTITILFSRPIEHFVTGTSFVSKCMFFVIKKHVLTLVVVIYYLFVTKNMFLPVCHLYCHQHCHAQCQDHEKSIAYPFTNTTVYNT